MDTIFCTFVEGRGDVVNLFGSERGGEGGNFGLRREVLYLRNFRLFCGIYLFSWL